MTGAWDPGRPTEGAYSATLSFECGAFASLTYSGYARFDSDAIFHAIRLEPYLSRWIFGSAGRHFAVGWSRG